MKRFLCFLLASVFVSSTFITTAFAYSTEFTNSSSTNTFYNRTTARNYLNSYTTTPNSAYFDYTYYGGDCTNFVSQMLRAGGMPMTTQNSNPTTSDWYYYGSNIPARTSTWTGAHYFRQYWGVVNGSGKKEAYAMYKYSGSELQGESAAYRNLVSRCELGDVIQLVDSSGRTYHSMGVQRVYTENGIRKVTISQHTANNFYHLTDKVATMSNSSWLCLIKMRVPASNSASMQSIQNVLGTKQVDRLLMNIPNSSSVSLSSLSTEQLDKLYTSLETKNISDSEEDTQRWEAVATIGSILDDRYAMQISLYGDDAKPKAAITKDLLLSMITDSIQNYEMVSQLPVDMTPLDYDAAVMTPSECNQDALAMLDKLVPFFNQVSSSSDDQLYALWCMFWEDILEKTVPSTYTLM